VAQPILVITLFEIFASMCATGLLAVLRGNCSSLGDFQQVLQLERFDARGVECLAFVRDLDIGDTLTQIHQLSDTLLHIFTGAEYTEVVLHAVLQLFAQRGDVLTSGTLVETGKTA